MILKWKLIVIKTAGESGEMGWAGLYCGRQESPTDEVFIHLLFNWSNYLLQVLIKTWHCRLHVALSSVQIKFRLQQTISHLLYEKFLDFDSISILYFINKKTLNCNSSLSNCHATGGDIMTALRSHNGNEWKDNQRNIPQKYQSYHSVLLGNYH